MTSETAAPAAPGADQTTVVIADDHALFTEALRTVLDAEDDLRTVAVAATLEDAGRFLEELAPDVLLLDHRMPDGDGISAIPGLKQRSSATAVIVVTASNTDDHLLAAIDGGAAGFLSKTRGLADLTASVRAAANGEAVISTELLNRLLTRISRRGAASSPTLTSREQEVMRLVARGMTNAQIASSLQVSVNTVRNHVANISSKLGAHSKLEALALATRRGLVDHDEI